MTGRAFRLFLFWILAIGSMPGSLLSAETIHTPRAYATIGDDGAVAELGYVFDGVDYPVTIPVDWSRRPLDHDLWAHGFQSLRWLRPLIGHVRLHPDDPAAGTLIAVLRDYDDFHRHRSSDADPLHKGDHTSAIRLRVLSESRAALDASAAFDASERARLADQMLRLVNMCLRDSDVARPDRIHNHQAMLAGSVVQTLLDWPDLDPRGEDLATAEQRFLNQALGLFTPSGVTREHSMSYQVFNAGILIDMLGWYADAGRTAPDAVASLVEKLQVFASYNLLPDGTMPGIGDSFVPYSLKVLQRLEQQVGTIDPGLRAVLGGSLDLPNRGMIWPDAGMAVLRPVVDGEVSHLFFMASCNSRIHKHDDDLSFTLFAGGRRIFADTAYDDVLCGGRDKESQAFRNLIATAAVHSTALVPGRRWRKPNPESTGLTACGSGDGWMAVGGRHRRIEGVTVERDIVMFAGDRLLIEDRVVGAEGDRVILPYHLDIGLTVDLEGEDVWVVRDEDFAVVAAVTTRPPLAATVVEGGGAKDADADVVALLIRHKQRFDTRALAFTTIGDRETVVRTYVALGPDAAAKLDGLILSTGGGARRFCDTVLDTDTPTRAFPATTRGSSK